MTTFRRKKKKTTTTWDNHVEDKWATYSSIYKQSSSMFKPETGVSLAGNSNHKTSSLQQQQLVTINKQHKYKAGLAIIEKVATKCWTKGSKDISYIHNLIISIRKRCAIKEMFDQRKCSRRLIGRCLMPCLSYCGKC